MAPLKLTHSLLLVSCIYATNAAITHPKLQKPTGPLVAADGQIGTAGTSGTLLVTLNTGVNIKDVAGAIKDVSDKYAAAGVAQAAGVKNAFNAVGVVEMTYTSEQAAIEILNSPGVKTAEFNQKYTIKQEPNMSWGWDRVTSAIDNRASFPGAGANTDVYVVDTGIRASHPDLGGRVVHGTSVFGDSSDDGHGHGTHVAGTVGGNRFGIATQATLIAVKVLDATGSGSTSGVVAGLDWVGQNLRAGRKPIINMSLGGGYSASMMQAVYNLYLQGVVVVCAAGNEAQNACNSSPGNAPGSFTVAASDNSDTLAYFSNYGSCVDIIAPGVGIWSVNFQGGYVSYSGTSMAAPHVAGAMAVYWGLNPAKTINEVRSAMQTLGMRNVISGSLGTTPNLLLYVGPEYNGGTAPTPTETTGPTDTGAPTGTPTDTPTPTSCPAPVSQCTTLYPCRNGGQCLDLSDGSYFCKCPGGYTGANCQIAPACARQNPCKNGGQCLNLANGSTKCVCPTGYSGAYCAVRINACATRPCRNGGTCHERLFGGFVCVCPSWWTGATCTTSIRCANNRLVFKKL